MKNKILSALPHINIVLALMLIVFFVIDRFNSAMAFINNDITKGIILAFSIISIIISILLISYQRKE